MSPLHPKHSFVKYSIHTYIFKQSPIMHCISCRSSPPNWSRQELDVMAAFSIDKCPMINTCIPFSACLETIKVTLPVYESYLVTWSQNCNQTHSMHNFICNVKLNWWKWKSICIHTLCKTNWMILCNDFMWWFYLTILFDDFICRWVSCAMQIKSVQYQMKSRYQINQHTNVSFIGAVN